MALAFKDALKKMVNERSLKFYFFFCEKDESGKPALLADTKKIDPKSRRGCEKARRQRQGQGHGRRRDARERTGDSMS